MIWTVSDILYILPAIVISMAIHEAMHAYTSHALGDTTAQDMGRLTLNPLKHIDVVTTVMLPLILILLGLPPIFIAKPVPFNPDRVKYDEYGAAMIALAGPFTNLALAGLASLILRFGGLSGFTMRAFVVFVAVNVAFFVFNMIPFPPLDGSRLLYAFAPEPLQNVMYAIERMGFMAIILFFFILVPVLGPIIAGLNNSLLNLLLGGIPGIY